MGGQAQRSETQRAQQPKYGMPEFVDTFLDKVNIQPERNSKLVKVSFSSFDPKLASQVANAIVSNYIEATLARRYNAGNEAREFLQKQLISMQVALERADQALQDFAKKKNVADLEERIRLATNKLKELNDRLTQVQVENVQFTVLKEQIAKGRADSLEQVMSNELVNKLQEEYVAAAAEYANLSGQFRPGYPKLLQVSEQMSQLEVQINKEKKRIIDSLNTKYSQLVEQDRVLQNAINEQEKQIMGLNQEAIQYNILKREVQTNKELYDGLLQRMKEVGVASGVQENNISVIDRAEVPMDSDKPNKRLNMLVALFLGLAGGIGLAFLLEYLDNTVRRPEDVENLLGLPAIGVIPLDHGRSSRKKARLGDHDISFHSLRKPRSEISEAFRSLRTSLMFSSPSGMPKTLLITSPAASEGKTSASVNLATVLAQSGGRVLLIDADLRRPRMHKVFGTASVPGLTQLIARKDAPTASYFHGTEVSGLLMLPSGIIPPNPPELLGSDAMKALLGELQGLFDYIIIDSAPILGLADALVLSRLVEGVFLITTAGRTSKENLKYAVKRLRQVHTPLLGVVLNAVDMKSPDYYYYYSSHYYHYDSHEAREEPSPKLAHGT
jgi:capsular exopolysaccharide synthesis family protein